jgi:hypothetical protein
VNRQSWFFWINLQPGAAVRGELHPLALGAAPLAYLRVKPVAGGLRPHVSGHVGRCVRSRKDVRRVAVRQVIELSLQYPSNSVTSWAFFGFNAKKFLKGLTVSAFFD